MLIRMTFFYQPPGISPDDEDDDVDNNVWDSTVSELNCNLAVATVLTTTVGWSSSLHRPIVSRES